EPSPGERPGDPDRAHDRWVHAFRRETGADHRGDDERYAGPHRVEPPAQVRSRERRDRVLTRLLSGVEAERVEQRTALLPVFHSQVERTTEAASLDSNEATFASP